jgi:hypothetical protein
MEEWSCTRSPVVVFQRRAFAEFCTLCPYRAEDGTCAHGEADRDTCEDAAKQAMVWVSERVFADVDQADAWRAPQTYRYADADGGRTWRYWAIPTEGSLEQHLRRVAEDERAVEATSGQAAGL